jgi:hypothetical protein
VQVRASSNAVADRAKGALSVRLATLDIADRTDLREDRG